MFPEQYGVMDDVTNLCFRNSGEFECLSGRKRRRLMNVEDWSDGCVLKIPFGCDTGDRFVKYSGLKLPDTSRTWIYPNMNLQDCRSNCIKNCSCKAYSNIDIREGGIGCMMWIDDLIDIRNYRENGLDLYVRVSASDAEAAESLGGKMRIRIISITLLVVIIILLCPFIIHVFRKRMRKRKGGYGTIYKAKRKQDGWTFAIKCNISDFMMALIGSFLVMVVAIILPCICYLSINQGRTNKVPDCDYHTCNIILDMWRNES